MFTKLSSFWRWLTGAPLTPPLFFRPRPLLLGDREYYLAPARPKEVSQLVEIERLIYTIPPWDETAFYYDLQRRNCLYLVVRDGDAVQGYAGMAVNFNAKDGHLTNVAVHPAAQRRGIATQLITALIQVAQENHLLTLSLEVRADNAPAQRLYRQLGFVRSGIKHEYYLEDGEDAYTMILTLNQTKGI